jgi:biopolymer transport protein ExbD
MRRKFERPQEGEEVNMTPLLDIVFIMLIFFIVTATFVRENGLDVSRPPESDAKIISEKQGILIRINNRDQIWLDDRNINVGAVRSNIERLLAEGRESTVLIQASEKAKTGTMVQIMDAARQAGAGFNITKGEDP